MRRRSFLAFGLGWFPFFHRRFLTLAGIRFRLVRHQESNRRYLLIHGNEQTAREVLFQHMRNHPGVAYLVAGSTRNVDLMGGKLDPNRMYSRVGAEVNLRKLNPEWQPEKLKAALDFLDLHRDDLLERLTPSGGEVLIALHNNSEGYNVNEELADSDATSLKEPARPHEFFLCTDPQDFQLLSQSPYNVVLQNRKPLLDDGSLSRLAAARSFRYINLETTLGEFSAQQERLAWLEQHLQVPNKS